MTTGYRIEIRLLGEDKTPEKLSSRELGNLLSSIEQMIAHIVARDNPALGIDESEVVVGLAAVDQGSYVLEFQTQHENEVAEAYHQVAKAITSSQYEHIPAKSIEAIRAIRTVTRHLNTETEFWESNGQRKRLATITTNTRIEEVNLAARGTTTLYGTVVRVGGEDPPRAKLRLLDGTELNCRITQRNALRIARELGARLYDRVGIRGVATWEMSTMVLQDFFIEEVLEYSHRDIEQAFASLSEVAGPHLERISDFDAFMADVRGGDGDH